MNIIKKLLHKKKDKEIEELKLKLIEAHGLYSKLKEKESALNNKLDLCKKDRGADRLRLASICQAEQCSAGLRLEKSMEKLRGINEQLKKDSKPKYKILHKKHHQELNVLNGRIVDLNIKLNSSKEDYRRWKSQDESHKRYLESELCSLRSKVRNMESEDSLAISALNDYKRDLDRALRVEAHYHDVVAENKKLKKEIKESKV